MTSKELLYVRTIAEECSVSKAAKKLYIAQPSLSQSLQRIEDTLGTRLFKRTANGLVLTYAGERYCAMANTILKMYENFENEVSNINGLKTGRIQMGITSHLGTVILPEVLPGFKELCPAIELCITEANSTELETMMLAGSLDFCLMYAPKEPSFHQIRYDFLTRDPFLLIAKKGHPVKQYTEFMKGYPYPVIDVSKLSDEAFVMLHESHRIRQVTNAILKKAGLLTPDIYVTVRNFETAQKLATAGVGLTLLPAQYSHILGTKFDAYSILDYYDAYWELCIASNRNVYLSKADQLFLQMVKKYFGHT